jgi:hypothetical protein
MIVPVAAALLTCSNPHEPPAPANPYLGKWVATVGDSSQGTTMTLMWCFRQDTVTCGPARFDSAAQEYVGYGSVPYAYQLHGEFVVLRCLQVDTPVLFSHNAYSCCHMGISGDTLSYSGATCLCGTDDHLAGAWARCDSFDPAVEYSFYFGDSTYCLYTRLYDTVMTLPGQGPDTTCGEMVLQGQTMTLTDGVSSTDYNYLVADRRLFMSPVDTGRANKYVKAR